MQEAWGGTCEVAFLTSSLLTLVQGHPLFWGFSAKMWLHRPEFSFDPQVMSV